MLFIEPSLCTVTISNTVKRPNPILFFLYVLKRVKKFNNKDQTKAIENILWISELITHLTNHFLQLDQWLFQHRQLWQPIPFYQYPFPIDGLQSVWSRLHRLSDRQVTHYQINPEKLSTELQEEIPGLADLSSLCLLSPITPTAAATVWPDSVHAGIKARKWEQIRQFTQLLPPLQGQVVDWCAGKGHLGRIVALGHHCTIKAIERDSLLCHAGKTLAEEAHTEIGFINRDVLKRSCADLIATSDHAVALHACGSLHVELIQLAHKHSLQTLAIAPCCYHLDQDPRPLSQIGREGLITPNREQLRMTLQEQVTAPDNVRRRRRRLNQMRLGFDLLQRDLRQSNNYLHTPPLANPWGDRPFTEICQHLSLLKGIVIPANIDFSKYEQQGIQREAKVVRMELLRHLFRRPIELWWLLDRAIYLQEAGYRVEMGIFCERHQSPRNVMLLATR